MDQSQFHESLKSSVTEFRNSLEKSIREMVQNLHGDALKNVKVGEDGKSVIRESFVSDLNDSIQNIVDSSLELAKQAAENGVSTVNEQGAPESNEQKHTMINGKTVE